MKKEKIFLIFLFFTIFIFNFSLSFSQTWLSGWQYRIPITIRENSGNTLTDYQILVTINTQNLISQGKMRSDCGDIRFTDSDGRTLLNYWIEDGCNSTNTKIWVKVPNIPANSNKIIYLYYGNPNANSMSNGDLVFEFFDDFRTNPNTNGKWRIFRYSNDVNNEFVWDNTNNQVYLTRNLNGKGVMAFFNKSFSPYNTITEFEIYIGGGNGADGLSFYFDKNINPYITYGRALAGGSMASMAFDGSNSYLSEGYSIGFDTRRNTENGYEQSTPHIEVARTSATNPSVHYSGAHLTSVSYSNLRGNWLKVVVIIKSNAVEVYINNVLQLSYTGLTSLNYNWQGIGASTGGYNDNHAIKNLRVRKFAPQEPTYTLGREESITLVPVWLSYFSNVSQAIINQPIKFSSLWNASQIPYLTQPSQTWLSGWQYRIPITIRENSGNTLTDYQILVTINTQNLISQGKMRSDCGDIRFTDSDGRTLLNYWIEDGCNSTNTKIWVKVPNIPANSNKIIYLYYGNPSATSMSNGDNTFIFFDDFSFRNISKWNWPDNWIIENNTAKQTVANWWSSELISQKLNIGISNYVGICIKTLAINDGTVRAYDVVVSVNISNSWYNSPFFTTSYAWYGFFDRICSGSGSCPYGETRQWRVYDIIIFTNNQTWYLDGSVIDSRNSAVGNIIYNFAINSKGVSRFDYFIVRKCSRINPIVSLGSEEILSSSSSVFLSNYIFSYKLGNSQWINETYRFGPVYQTWLSGWQYRIPITIRENSGNTLTDYQILVTINTQNLISQGKMRNDCGDIRFIDSDGSILLNYWIESGCNTTNTRIWVKVPNIPANSQKTIYLYYGNPSATSMSNGTSTFIFFDDFEDGDYTNNPVWNIDTGQKICTSYCCGSYSASNRYLELTSGFCSLNLYSDLPQPISPQKIAIDFNSWWTGTHCYNNEVLLLNSSNAIMIGGGGVLCDYHSIRALELRVNNNFYSSSLDFPYGTWHRITIIFNGTHYTVRMNDVNTYSISEAIYPYPITTIYIGGWQHSMGAKFDNIRIRKYTSPEPTVSIGNEETMLPFTAWANVTKSFSQPGTLCWKFYANNTLNLWNVTPESCLNIISPDFWLEAKLLDPRENSIINLIPGEGIQVKANVTLRSNYFFCTNGNATLRYNTSTSMLPNTAIPTSSAPITTDTNPIYVGNLCVNNSTQVVFNLIANSQTYKIVDVNFCFEQICNNTLRFFVNVSITTPRNLTLKKGWNLISIPYKTINLDLNRDGCNLRERVFHYFNASSNSWEYHTYKNLRGGIAYWIYSEKNCESVLYVSDAVTPNDMPGIIRGKKNYIGSLSSSRSLQEIYTNIRQLCNSVSIARWDSERNAFLNIDISSNLTPWYGYILECS
ncbi:MAG: DUF2341 domain-containing protein [Candidatus Aenigmatarchaeota archaeon]